MATIHYKIQSKSDNAPIYLVLSAGRNKLIYRKVGKTINCRDWSNKTNLPKQNNAHLKELSKDLRDLKNDVLDELVESKSLTKEDLAKWLEYRIDLFFGNVKEQKENNSVVDYIQGIIDNASTKVSSGGKIGLSKNRVKGYVTFKGLIENYESYSEKKLEFKDLDINFEDNFRAWLITTKKYSLNYAGKNIDNLKAVCNDADRKGMEVNPHASKILTFSESKGDREVITLSFDELDMIENTTITKESLINVRKWLLLGCEIGQRGGDLLNITLDDFNARDGFEYIDLVQQKTGAEISISVNRKIQRIKNSGLPYKLSIQKFNDYLKDLCRLAGINEPTKGKLYDAEKKRKIAGIYPKFKLITSHSCRRSFATNYYKHIITPVLMSYTGHSKEELFLSYIGVKKDKDENAKLMKEYQELMEARKNETKMQILKASIQ